MVVFLLALIAVILLFGGIAVRNAIGGMLIVLAAFCALIAIVLFANYAIGGNAGLWVVGIGATVLMIYGFTTPSPKEVEARLAADRVSRSSRPNPWPVQQTPPGGERTISPKPRR